MSHPCQYKVAVRTRRGPAKGQKTIAQFADRTDAMNFGYQKSKARFGHSSNIDVVVYDLQGRVYRRIRQGVLQ
jgi:hypothetical protein